MEGFSIKIEYYSQDNNIVIVKLSGYVDQHNSHQIEKTISDLLQSKKQNFIFDFSQLIYMSSAGWGIFVGEIKTVRDAGGDIKLASMSPEVYDVFQVLEFYHILEDYSTVNDAIYSFTQNGNGETADLLQDSITTEEDKSIDNLLEFSGVEPQKTSNKVNETVTQEEIEEESKQKIEKKGEKKPKRKTIDRTYNAPQKEVEVDISMLPLNEKIKKIIAIYPLLNLKQMRKILHHEKFGYTKVNSYKLYKILKSLNLHKKKLRYRYYRST